LNSTLKSPSKKSMSVGTERSDFSMYAQIILYTCMKPNTITSDVIYFKKSMNVKAAGNDAC